MEKCCWLYAGERVATYAACFMGKTIAELVDDFNREVEVATFSQDRAYYHQALMKAFQERGVDVRAVTDDGVNIDWKKQVRFDEESRALVKVEGE